MLETIKEEPYFGQTKQDLFFFSHSTSTKLATLNKLRAMLKCPSLSDQIYQDVSLRTVFTRLVVKLFEKCRQYSDQIGKDEKSAEIIKKSAVFPGVSRVFVWLSTLCNVLMNEDGVNCGIINAHFAKTSTFYRKINRTFSINGHVVDNRRALVEEEHGLTLQRL